MMQSFPAIEMVSKLDASLCFHLVCVCVCVCVCVSGGHIVCVGACCFFAGVCVYHLVSINVQH